MLHLAAVWPRLSVRCDGIYRDKTAEHKINEESIFRKSQKYVRMSDLCRLNTRGVVFYLVWLLRCKRLSYIKH